MRSLSRLISSRSVSRLLYDMLILQLLVHILFIGRFMKIRNFFLLNVTLLFFSFSLISCSGDDDKEANSGESQTLQYTACAKQLIEIIDGDTARIMPMARMLDSTPDSVAYIMKNQLLPDENLSQRINTLYTDYIDNGESFKRLRNDHDSEYRWYEYVLDYPWLHPWWFWIGVIIDVLIIILMFI